MQQQKVSPQKRQISQVLQQQKLSQQQQEVDQLQIQQSRKNIDDLFESDVSDEFEDNSTDPETFRNRIFNYAYQYVRILFKADIMKLNFIFYSLRVKNRYI